MISRLALLLLLTAACSKREETPSTEPASKSVPAPPAAPVRLEVLPESLHSYFRVNSGLEDRARLVVRDEQTWTQVWSRIVANHSPRPATPRVDFSTKMVLVAAAGTKRSGGHDIEITGFDAAASSASVLNVVPGNTCMTTAALTTPVDIVLVPRVAREVAWEERELARECGS